MKLHLSNWLYDPIIGNFASWMLAGLIMSPYVNGWSDHIIFPVLGMSIGPIWTIWLHAYRQSIRVQVHKQEIHHKRATILRGAVILVVSVLSQLLVVGPGPHLLISIMACFFYLATIFWLFFDFFINYHLEQPLLYIDQGETAADTDKFFKDKKVLWIASKIILIVLGALAYKHVLTHI